MGQSKLKISDNKQNRYHILAIIFWLVIWQIVSMLVDKEMLLASPMAVIKALIELIGKSMFWKSIAHSFFKIVSGFFFAIVIGVLFAVMSYGSIILKEIISLVMKIIKAIPVASFVIVALLWVSSMNLSILISFLMVLPIIYFNVLQGLHSTDPKLLDMAKVFRVGIVKKIRYLYIPAVMPYFVSACSIGLGFCWKSGIAAEVIGLPKNSIGEQLYEAKLYLMTKELFAWTIIIILISMIFEKLIMWFLKILQRRVSDK